MIRLNVFFEAKDSKAANSIVGLVNQLVSHSRKDTGCVSYGCFRSTDNDNVFIICETWAYETSLKRHSEQKHSHDLVPEITNLTKAGFHTEKFSFPPK